MGDEYRQLSQHRQRAHCAVRYERGRDYQRAAEAWLLVARQSPEIMWQRWALLRATLCQQRAEEK
ncbi:hypothetical protein [Hafnia paralvei]|uniref:hypothetical protein n=1 Tax=Hafnia paralvei TaxID=546367 RepID=UPI0010352F74|nr:hypothetical protein [Hafnia paralvei]TBL64327.1 hypothetical protein EYY97_04270 [Hafnia paralvei]